MVRPKKLITVHMLQSKENLPVETDKHMKVHDYWFTIMRSTVFFFLYEDYVDPGRKVSCITI